MKQKLLSFFISDYYIEIFKYIKHIKENIRIKKIIER